MSGIIMAAIGFILIILATVVMVVVERIIRNKKRRIREQIYHIHR